METFDRRDICKEKLQLSSVIHGLFMSQEEWVYNRGFLKISPEKKIRKQMRCPFIFTVLQSILFLCLLICKRRYKKSKPFLNAVITRHLSPMIWTLYKLLIWVKRAGKNHHLGSSSLFPVTGSSSQMQIKKCKSMCDSHLLIEEKFLGRNFF